MNIVIIGGLGYIGSHLTKALHIEGHDVIVVDRKHDPKLMALIGLKTERFVHADVDEVPLESIAEQIRDMVDGVDVVMHLAEDANIDELQRVDIRHHRHIVSVRAINMMNLTSILNVDRMIYASSGAVYQSNPIPMTEDSPIRTDGCTYSMSKISAEKSLCSFGVHMGVRVTILRYGNPIGCKYGITYDKLDNTHSLGAIMADYLRGGRDVFTLDQMTVDGRAVDPVRSFIDICRFLRANIKVITDPSWMEEEFPIYNIGGSPHTPRQLLSAFLSHHSIPNPRPGTEIRTYQFMQDHYRVAHGALNSGHFERRFQMSLNSNIGEIVECIR